MLSCSTYRPLQLRTALHRGSVGASSVGGASDYAYSYSITQIAYTQCYSTSSETSLVHMNGRAYASGLQRFLSPDPFLQDPANAQNHNRYAYCLNNPLRYTDPSGYQVAPLAQAIDNWMEMMRSLHRDVDMAIHCAVAGGWYLSGTVDGRKHFQGLFWETEVNRSTNSGGGGNSSGWEWTPRGYGGMGRTANGGRGGGFERGGHGGGGGGQGGRTGGGGNAKPSSSNLNHIATRQWIYDGTKGDGRFLITGGSLMKVKITNLNIIGAQINIQDQTTYHEKQILGGLLKIKEFNGNDFSFI